MDAVLISSLLVEEQSLVGQKYDCNVTVLTIAITTFKFVEKTTYSEEFESLTIPEASSYQSNIDHFSIPVCFMILCNYRAAFL